MRIILETKFRNWYQGDNYFSIGYMYIDGKLLKDNQLGLYIYNTIQQEKISEVLFRTNGSFAVICFVANQIYLIVDKLRSYPLLYTVQNNRCTISDSANGFNDDVNNYSLNELAAMEFLSLGHLSGNKTLLKNIYEVEAGSWVMIDNEKKIIIEEYNNYFFAKQNLKNKTLMEEASTILEEAFIRMLKTIGNKKIVIPLSGGYDSRLIACLCRKMNIKNVICFTYGRKDSFEVSISKEVASRLGFDWYFIEYTPEIISKWIHSSTWEKYVKYVGNLNVNPSIQGLFAVLELTDRKIVDPQSSVFIPGHSGDALGGSHMVSIDIMQHKPLEQVLFAQYYKQNSLHIEWENKIIELLHDAVGSKKMSINEKYDKHYYWNVKNRQANFIVNSARTFEFIGSEWRIPLWDAEYSTFWDKVSWIKKGEKIYDRFMFECYFHQMNVAFAKDSYGKFHIKKIANQLLPTSLRIKIRNLIKPFSKKIVQPHFNSFDIMVNNLPCSNYEQFCKEIKSDIDSTLSRYYLDIIMRQFLK